MANYTVTLTRVSRVVEHLVFDYRDLDGSHQAVALVSGQHYDELDWTEIGAQELEVSVKVSEERA